MQSEKEHRKSWFPIDYLFDDMCPDKKIGLDIETKFISMRKDKKKKLDNDNDTDNDNDKYRYRVETPKSRQTMKQR